MRKVAILAICLLSSSCAANIANTGIANTGIANTESQPAAKDVPPDYRAQVVRQMSQAYNVARIRDAGITPPIFTSVSLMHGSRWVVCIATFEDAVLFGTFHRLTIVTFNNGQAEILSARTVRVVKGGTDGAARTKLNVSGPCRGLITSPLPEVVRAGMPS
jgi:hypothetical protein